MSVPPWIELLPEGGLLFFMVLFAAVLTWVFFSGSRAAWAHRASLPLDDAAPSTSTGTEVTHG